MFIAIAVSLPTFIDSTIQLFGFRESNNLIRFSTGLIAGFGLIILTKSIKFYLGVQWSLISKFSYF